MRRTRLIITCEHGGNRVPREHRRLFAGRERVLASHRGWDAGALALARRLATALDAPLHHSRVTRLLVDLNRSPRNRSVFSAATTRLDDLDRAALLRRWHAPYRRGVEAAVRRVIDSGEAVVHVSVHSFTPVLHGVRRNAEVGLLYDPSRRSERLFAATWREAMRAMCPSWRVRMNYPYRGTSDGLTTALRRRFAAGSYAGIELEVNQAMCRGAARRFPDAIERAIVESLCAATRTMASERAGLRAFVRSR
jgi:predicted N-formylglutamate amidohydrolase